MTSGRPASLGLLGYYVFLLLLTALSYGDPYPIFGVLLGGAWARAAVVADCLVLIHIVAGVWKAQRLSWHLLLGYNLFELASLAVTLLHLGPADLQSLGAGDLSTGAFYSGVLVAAGAMVVATVYAFRLRDRFDNRSPWLF